MRRVLLPILLLAPTLALAQVTITETGDKPDEVVNIRECQGDTGAKSTLAFQWTISSLTFSQIELRVSDTTNCPTSTSNSTAHTSSLGTFPGSTTIYSLAAPDVMNRIGIPTSACGTGANVTVYVCALPLDVNGTALAGSAVSGTFTLDRSIPATPTVPNVTPGDKALNVSWEAVSGSRISYRVELALHDAPDTIVRTEEVTTGTSTRVGSLQIGVTYDVTVIAISEGGNESGRSPVATGTPVVVNDFWTMYQNAGGREQGGCSTSGAASAMLLAFVPFALRRRRS